MPSSLDLFVLLPTELRIKVWHMVAQNVEGRYFKYRASYVNNHLPSVPAILQVNREARWIGLQYYRLMHHVWYRLDWTPASVIGEKRLFSSKPSGPAVTSLYTNVAKDLFEVNDRLLFVQYNVTLLNYFSIDFIDNIHKLCVHFDWDGLLNAPWLLRRIIDTFELNEQVCQTSDLSHLICVFHDRCGLAKPVLAWELARFHELLSSSLRVEALFMGCLDFRFITKDEENSGTNKKTLHEATCLFVRPAVPYQYDWPSYKAPTRHDTPPRVRNSSALHIATNTGWNGVLPPSYSSRKLSPEKQQTMRLHLRGGDGPGQGLLRRFLDAITFARFRNRGETEGEKWIRERFEEEDAREMRAAIEARAEYVRYLTRLQNAEYRANRARYVVRPSMEHGGLEPVDLAQYGIGTDNPFDENHHGAYVMSEAEFDARLQAQLHEEEAGAQLQAQYEEGVIHARAQAHHEEAIIRAHLQAQYNDDQARADQEYQDSIEYMSSPSYNGSEPYTARSSTLVDQHYGGQPWIVGNNNAQAYIMEDEIRQQAEAHANGMIQPPLAHHQAGSRIYVSDDSPSRTPGIDAHVAALNDAYMSPPDMLPPHDWRAYNNVSPPRREYANTVEVVLAQERADRAAKKEVHDAKKRARAVKKQPDGCAMH